MKSVLDVEVSCFPNYYEEIKTEPINLLTWLKSTKHFGQQQVIQAIPDKQARNEAKALMPAITPHGLFSYRAADALIRHSGLMQFDIDYTGKNKEIGNFSELKQQLCNIENVAYCGLSISG